MNTDMERLISDDQAKLMQCIDDFERLKPKHVDVRGAKICTITFIAKINQCLTSSEREEMVDRFEEPEVKRLRSILDEISSTPLEPAKCSFKNSICFNFTDTDKRKRNIKVFKDKIHITGCNSLDGNNQIIKYCCEWIRLMIEEDCCMIEYKIGMFNCCLDVDLRDHKLDLDLMYLRLVADGRYQPRLNASYAGLVVVIDEKTAIIFASGKVLLTGMNNVADIVDVGNKVVDVIDDMYMQVRYVPEPVVKRKRGRKSNAEKLRLQMLIDAM
jgi:TATA-box binding protein (TBP) (component of TFIID and TFIIIB)